MRHVSKKKKKNPYRLLPCSPIVSCYSEERRWEKTSLWGFYFLLSFVTSLHTCFLLRKHEARLFLTTMLAYQCALFHLFFPLSSLFYSFFLPTSETFSQNEEKKRRVRRRTSSIFFFFFVSLALCVFIIFLKYASEYLCIYFFIIIFSSSLCVCSCEPYKIHSAWG